MKPLYDPQHGEDDLLWMGWKWFEFHAKQRLDTFKFFVTIYGAITALALGLLKTNILVSTGLSVLALFTAVVFHQLDNRCRKLIEIGEQIVHDRWRERSFPDGLNPVKNSAVKSSDELRYKTAFFLFFLGAAIGAIALFTICIVAMNFAIALPEPKVK